MYIYIYRLFNLMTMLLNIYRLFNLMTMLPNKCYNQQWRFVNANVRKHLFVSLPERQRILCRFVVSEKQTYG